MPKGKKKSPPMCVSNMTLRAFLDWRAGVLEQLCSRLEHAIDVRERELKEVRKQRTTLMTQA